jgi:hypothetical protein
VRRHPDEKHPLVLLAEERHRCQSLVDMYERKLNAVIAERGEESLMTHGGRDLAGWLKAYNQERDRLTKMNETWLALGIADRMVSIAQSQAQDVIGVIRGTLRELGVSDVEAGPIMSRRFRELARARALPTAVDTASEEVLDVPSYDNHRARVVS